ncbi:MAG: M24 family metallopeptidase, partial [Dehalococcoidia bacterium]
ARLVEEVCATAGVRRPLRRWRRAARGASTGLARVTEGTITVTAGKPDAKFQAIYDIVFEAQQAAIEGVEAGMSGVTAHRLASKVIGGAGYGENFGHGLGHGVGLEVHESPYLGESSQDVLEEGMVFTIEPGIYLPGWGGVRIEDVVVLENGRARVLSHAKKLTPAGVS